MARTRTCSSILFHSKIHQVLFISCAAILFSGCLGSYKRAAYRQYADVVRSKQKYDAIIVPGIPFTGDSMGYLLRSRIIWSWVLYKNGVTSNIIYSGGAVHTPYQEARVMGLYAQQLGIPAEHIFYDTCAYHTTENLYYSYQMAKAKGFQKIAVASDIYQCFFLRPFIARKLQNRIDQLPMRKDTVSAYRYLNLCIDPTPALITNSAEFIPLGEKQNYWKRMKGTLGFNIPWKEASVN